MQNTPAIPSSVRTPYELSNWLSKEFKYEMKVPDCRQSPQETVELKKGDCDDFAMLAQAALSRMGIEGQVIVIKFRGLKICHAVCVFNDGGNYSFFSNQEIIRTNEPSIAKAIQKEYPDWEEIFLADTNNKYTKRIFRKG